MAYETKNNTGTVFANDRKETPSHPDYTGQALIDGADYWLSAWKKQSQSGKSYLSFSFKPKADRHAEDHKGNRYDPATPQPARFDDSDDFVPF